MRRYGGRRDERRVAKAAAQRADGTEGAAAEDDACAACRWAAVWAARQDARAVERVIAPAEGAREVVLRPATHAHRGGVQYLRSFNSMQYGRSIRGGAASGGGWVV
eukprot:2131825-Prymnesium_polylepis.1